VQGGRNTLVLREVTEESVTDLLEKKDSLASCDVAAFVYDRYEPEAFFLCFSLTLNVEGIWDETQLCYNSTILKSVLRDSMLGMLIRQYLYNLSSENLYRFSTNQI